jgi:hypothetical protein
MTAHPEQEVTSVLVALSAACAHLAIKILMTKKTLLFRSFP